LGFSILGQCAYDPSKPFSVYFSLGEVIGALAFTLAVQQLLKPIYLLRLECRRLSLRRLYGCVAIAAIAVLVAAILPHVPLAHRGAWGYPILWEIAATLLFFFAYGAVVVAALVPVRVGDHSVRQFSTASASLLSAARETDHLDFVRDLRRSLPYLVRTAAYADGLHDNPSGFFLFANRRRLERSRYAQTLLRILADAEFCKTLVCKAGWSAAAIIDDLADQQLYTRSAEQFVREVARQAIVQDESILAREIGFHGFGAAPELSNALFSSAFILRMYSPFNWSSTLSKWESPNAIARLNKVVGIAVGVIIESRGWAMDQRVTIDVRSHYQWMFMLILREREKEPDYSRRLALENAVRQATKLAQKLERSDRDLYDYLFVSQHEKGLRFDVLQGLTDVVFDALSAVANDFKGGDDRAWGLAIEVFMNGLDSLSHGSVGLSPFQQRLALKLMEGLEKNMKGFYPAISRIMLACMGPYKALQLPPHLTAGNILRQAMYAELKKFPDLADMRPDQLDHYLPDNVSYDAATSSFDFKYRFGRSTFVDLQNIDPLPVSLYDPALRCRWDDLGPVYH
jgi:hypothetical protein